MTNPLLANARDRLHRLIQESNPNFQLAPYQYQFSVPSNTSANGKNTVITIIGVPEVGTTGQEDVFYNRLDLNQQMGLINENLELAIDSVDSTYDLLIPIYEQYGINLLNEDVVLQTVGGNSHNLTVNPNSTGWVGSASLTLVPVTYVLADLLTDTNITGFLYPTQTPEESVASIYQNTKEHLLQLINLENDTNLTLDNVTISLPSVAPIDAFGRNTTVTLTPIVGSVYVGDPVTIKYRRVTADTIYPDRLLTGGNMESIQTTHDLLQLLRDNENVKLTNNEVDDTAINLEAEEAYLVMSANSYAFSPGTALRVELPHENALEDLINSPLDGLNYQTVGADLQQILKGVFATPYDIGIMEPAQLDLSNFSRGIAYEQLNKFTWRTLDATNTNLVYFQGVGEDVEADLNAINGQGYRNQLYVKYKRMNLSDYLTSVAPLHLGRVIVPEPTLSPTLVDSVIDFLNSTYNLDLFAGRFTLVDQGGGNWELQIDNNDLAWYANVLLYSGV